jgi:ribosomal subunit interface protein
MDLVLSGRGTPITDRIRQVADHKLAGLARVEPRATRIAIEIIVEKNPRLRGTKHVEATLQIPRKTFRAKGEATDVESALDQVAERLERQVRDYHDRRRTRMVAGANRVKSANSPERNRPVE